VIVGSDGDDTISGGGDDVMCGRPVPTPSPVARRRRHPWRHGDDSLDGGPVVTPWSATAATTPSRGTGNDFLVGGSGDDV